MGKYFDQDFFKLFLVFASIISISVVIILATRIYEKRSVASSATTTPSEAKISTQ